ncbi:MAG TPA: ribonuclease H-like domain-containing protein [Solirubrobacteraceae bacterium]|nr:ribonuclease H-like domain-containing protein [Solirubrobacteraceae bacterium]
MKALVYDIEIGRAILGRNDATEPGIEYCAGWHDYANMGISVIGAYDYAEDRARVFCRDNALEFKRVIERSDILVGFNNLAFDNKVIEACWGPDLQLPEGWQAKCYDLLVEIWGAAGLPPQFHPRTHGGYGLDAMAMENFQTHKTGNGALAPAMWQRGQLGEVIDYCLNDIRLTKQLFDKVLKDGTLISPRDGSTLSVMGPR